MYWLEFKNDDELPALFGSIGGGSALKFGIYQKAATGKWMGLGAGPRRRGDFRRGAPSTTRVLRGTSCSSGCRSLSELPSDASDADYPALQSTSSEHLPLVGDWSWAHKYFHLVFPDKARRLPQR